MSTTKTIDISKLSEAQQNLFKSLFEQFCERSEPKEETNPCGLKNGDTYYFITDDGHICMAKWQGRASDFRRLALGNVFKTEKDTEFAIEKQKVRVELQIYADGHNDPNKEDWDEVGIHYDIVLEYKNRYKKALNTQPAFTFKGMDCVYFTSKEIADAAIETIGKERILKYMFNIESEENE